jgi:hypothetical protein
MTNNKERVSEEKKVPESFKTYEDGKHRRYTLLFAVNGGAFAVAKLFTDPHTANVLESLTRSSTICWYDLYDRDGIGHLYIRGEDANPVFA